MGYIKTKLFIAKEQKKKRKDGGVMWGDEIATNQQQCIRCLKISDVDYEQWDDGYSL